MPVAYKAWPSKVFVFALFLSLFATPQGLMRAFNVEDLPIESKMLTKALDEAQRKVENYFFDIRKQLFEYDQVREGREEGSSG